MIWLAWRQFRGSAAMMAAVLVLLAVALALTGPGLASTYSAGIANCTENETCVQFFNDFFRSHQFPFTAASLIVLILPALVGLFWGAPLITRELEASTHLLVWNQSITRSRWLAVKLALIGLATVTAAGGCSLMVTWWSAPLDKSAPENLALMAPLVFGARGIVPFGYAAFAFVLGVTVGFMVRRTLPAMALTLAAFAAFQLAMPTLVRPYLNAPVTSAFELSMANVEGIAVPQTGGGNVRIMLKRAVPGDAGAWVLSNFLVDSSGRTVAVGDGEMDAALPLSTTSGPCSPAAGPEAGDACMIEINRLGYRQQVTYQPLARFWPFQWMETGIYALLTLGLTWMSFWWIRRRVS